MTITQIARNLQPGNTAVEHDNWLAALDALETLSESELAQLDEMIVPGATGELPVLISTLDTIH